MKRIALFVLLIVLISTVLMAGCTAQSGVKNSANEGVPSPTETLQDNVHTQSQTATNAKTVSSQSGSSHDKAGDSFFNIKIVPATELDKLQKEMSPDESLVKNDKEYVIGIISSKGLTLRGDLLQLEQSQGISGKEFDKTDVALHLLDITFGLDNSKINLFKTDKKYKFWFDGYYTDSEVAYVINLSKKLNTISGTTQFEDEEATLGFLQTNYAVVPYNFYNIKTVTSKMLKQLYDDKKDSDHLFKDKNGVLIGIVNSDYLYLIDTLNEDDQKYYILKGLLYSMGLHGISYQNKESFFYRNEDMNKNLSDLDIEAIRLLYGGGLKSGNTLEDAKKTIGIPV